MNDEEKMIAPCGLDCSICDLYLCKDNPDLQNKFIAHGLPAESVPCSGCRSRQGKLPINNQTCQTYQCAESKQHQFCSNCSDFPCNKIAPAADKSTILPHNIKMINLATIQNQGLEKFMQKSKIIKDNYFMGELIVGAGPQITPNKE